MNTKHALAGAHPRSRGENVLSVDAEGPLAGSSPLTRGKRVLVVRRAGAVGLIPAHAGKTIASAPRSTAPRAHPRSRGENEIEALLDPEQQGSSPLTRGKLHCIGNGRARHRLIPAHAGKTTTAPRRLSALWAHPRSRGENNPISSQRPARSGSSPLTRGKLDAEGQAALRRRLIPAHAGKTL